MEPWQWPEEQWRGHVEHVRAGRELAAPGASRWPDQADVAVLLSFDSDHETLALRDGETSPGRMAQGEFGARVAVPRVLDLLDRHGVPATFFMPAVCASLRPDEAPSYVARGHEVGLHGWIHERNTLLSAEDESELVERSARVFEEQLGFRPTGIRTPSWDFSPHTLSIIREHGFEYDSSLMADTEPYELLERGERTGVVEIPVEWIRDDAPYLTMDRFSGLRPQISPREVLRIWTDEFDRAREQRGLFQLTLHPHVIGHRSRLWIVDELLAHIRRFDDVWVGTHGALARHVRAQL
ncbi:polysaccharide deacetylase family protein [Leifsonia shinshuensis]|uniref:Peptidoglycan/xylan/chitin deacetylase (PgdA/CDA1 family) n=1 Tax=Leifsonia shinshuensis TaxID=150026 RepID=A0A853D3G8_9MICO|nr:polysaccharide deacetylase [Leifsonia shinshuensis]NYJ25934.1 peptidoglycan/xylan/chitin deacetylase (PgdA/CDA1 family) [Leifsonia shinshuensis]